ncbi:MAG: glycoside hydrolase family 2 TIM barrel-domain containing protein [Candidatus Pseudobacter hemicellulosilyticus]|uniref:beta-mannosidase n=1 Tax=Candidatus Pseudobacter hemicellulosilyticus TaxID=3121375 RepID=A0AAJ5WTT2_9BACT|nr:MAG: glycoside hydrolase family 2 TIM barrel-domain containing protein [Pseudobacter sp.]
MNVSIGSSQEKRSLLNWEIGYHQQATDKPAKWLPATVPGAVQLDVMKAEHYKQPYWYGDNVLQFDWMEDWYFTYRTSFAKPALGADQRLFFHSKGIDYHFTILLNGQQIHEQEGMFTYVDLDLTDRLQAQNELLIILRPVPKIEEAKVWVKGTETYRQNARESAKPAVSYGWDWHPRLVTRGIWDETFLAVRNKAHLTAAPVTYTLNEERNAASLQLDLEGRSLAGTTYRWLIKDDKGKLLVQQTGPLSADQAIVKAQLDKPRLWWPNGYGDPVLYTSELELLGPDKKLLDKRRQQIGFRTIKLIMNEGAWDEPADFPVTRNVSPASFEVNGQRIFAKGTNWVHPEIFVGLITPALYEKQVRLAKDANMNILRVWGGGITNKESFFDYCDQYGLLVWQEFPLACNNYTDKQSYLDVLEREARSIISRVKTHPCLAVWSGGNELFNSWSRMTDQSLALRLLNSLCYQLDQHTPFIFTSPQYGMGHGYYVFADLEKKEELYQWMSRATKTSYTEYGVPGAASVDMLKSFIPANELFPPKANTAWELHHGLGAWGDHRWLDMQVLEHYFGKIQSLEELVKYSQLTQSEGLQFIYEEARRQKPYCSMALNWCFQEPWPAAANNSLISWPNEVKPAYYSVAKACRPVLASARAPKFSWATGEAFTADVFLLNDTYQALPAADIMVTINFDGKEQTILEWDCPGTRPFENGVGPTARVTIPELKTQFFTVKVAVKGKPEYNSEYTFLHIKNTKR